MSNKNEKARVAESEEGEKIIQQDIIQRAREKKTWKDLRILWHSVAPYINCYDDKTEVLTDKGWKLFEDIINEKVMTYNSKSEVLEWQDPLQKIVMNYAGKMYKIKTKQVNLVVTPDHRMLIAKRQRNNSWLFREECAKSIKGLHVKYLKSGRWVGTPFKPLRGTMKEWSRFLGYYLSEGHIDHNPCGGNYTISLTQIGSRRKKMKKAFQEITPFKVYENQHHLSVRDKELWKYLGQFGYAKDKYIPKELKEAPICILKEFLKSYAEGDGSKCQPLLFTISKRLRDDLQEISIKAGYGSNYGIHSKAGRRGAFGISKYDCWNVSQVRKEQGVNKEQRFDEEVWYDGKVYCLQVPNSWLLIRREGKAVISGNSGYGTVTRYFMSGLLNRGMAGFVSAYYGLQPGGMINWKGIYVLPVIKSQADQLGFNSSFEHYRRFQCDLGIFHADFWVSYPFAKKIPYSLCYSPLDHEQYPDKWLEVLRAYKWIATPSMHAHNELKKSGIESTFVPHGVNIQAYHPLDKALSRKAFTLDKDKFIIGIVAANNDDETRKGWDQNFQAIKFFLDNNPDAQKDTIAFIHTDPQNERGRNLVELSKQIGIEKFIIWNDRYTASLLTLPDSAMCKLYNCFDVFLLLSRREGFCIPALEAQACGVPCILNDFSALSERNDYGKCGWLVKPAALVYSPLNALTSIPDPHKGAEALAEAYNNNGKREQFAKKSLAFAKRQTWDISIDKYFVPLLEKIFEETQADRKAKEVHTLQPKKEKEKVEIEKT